MRNLTSDELVQVYGGGCGSGCGGGGGNGGSGKHCGSTKKGSNKGCCC